MARFAAVPVLMMSALAVQCAAPPRPVLPLPPTSAEAAPLASWSEPPVPARPRHPKPRASEPAAASAVIRPAEGQTIVSYGNPVQVGLSWSGHAPARPQARTKYFFDVRQESGGSIWSIFSTYANLPRTTVVLPPASAHYRWRVYRVRAKERSYEADPWSTFSVRRVQPAPVPADAPSTVAASSPPPARYARSTP